MRTFWWQCVREKSFGKEKNFSCKSVGQFEEDGLFELSWLTLDGEVGREEWSMGGWEIVSWTLGERGGIIDSWDWNDKFL